MVTLRCAGFKGNILVCFLLLGLLLACVPRIPGISKSAPEIGDGGFLSGEPCGPPCFMGIAPGVTTEAEATQILQTEKLDQECEAFDSEAESGYRGFSCLSGVLISFQQGTDIVGVVGFEPSQTITIEEVAHV